MAQTILDQNGLLVIEDAAKVNFFSNPLVLTEGIRSVIAVPLKIHGQPVGILYLNDFVPRRYSPEKLEQLTIISSFASLSIANARLYQRTREMAVTDGLTGLYNHGQFKHMLEQELARSDRYGHPLSLIMFDIDNFKSLNDTYGHPCGDQILVQIAAALGDVFRGTDQVFRYGGEEFTVLLPEANMEQATTAAERTRLLISQLRIDWQDIKEQLRVTVSAGVATSAQSGTTPEDLLNTVDERLYRAKRAGKNCVFSSDNLYLKASP
jgi:diguanylate cyclase (GGDEF)-like protein